MRPDGVVDSFPLAELTIELFHFERANRDLVKLLGVSAVGAFHRAIEFGGSWRQHEQMKTALLASPGLCHF